MVAGEGSHNGAIGAIERARRDGAPPAVWLFLGLVATSVVGLLAAPWGLEAKLYAVVHGLCAQRPSHSFVLGGHRLPFDARMTGIYGGFLVTTAYLLARGTGQRWRAAQLPPRSVALALGLFVALMGLDGVNSTLQDFGLPYAYEPDNRLRLATGLLLGAGLGVLIPFLLNNTLWAQPVEAPILGGWRELGAVLALEGLFFLIVVSGWGAFYLPVALGLVLSGVVVACTLALALLVLLLGREGRYTRPADVAGLASAALLLGYAALALIAGGRFYLEHVVGMSPMG